MKIAEIKAGERYVGGKYATMRHVVKIDGTSSRASDKYVVFGIGVGEERFSVGLIAFAKWAKKRAARNKK